ncbi:MAG TPA: GntR family transcriptional regulator [Syntrophorhabdaceae bacterium]|nr:GntR family transcriptional regulator [Syntrophorhabdaceae bacterium]
MTENEGIPYYVQIAETVRRRIMTDEYMEGSLLPPVPELQEEFNVSNITIRKALETLTRDGLLRRKRGLGTIVQKCERDLVVLDLSGGFKTLVRSIEALPLDIEVLDIKVIPSPNYVRQILFPDKGSQVLCIKKIRKYRGMPLSYYVHYTDPKLYPKISKEAVEQKTFVALYEELSGNKLVRLKQRIEAVVADIDLSAVLEMRFGLPLFFTENLYLTGDDKPAVVTQNYYRGDKCFYKSSTAL